MCTIIMSIIINFKRLQNETYHLLIPQYIKYDIYTYLRSLIWSNDNFRIITPFSIQKQQNIMQYTQLNI